MDKERVEEVLIYTNDIGWRNHFCECEHNARLFKIGRDLNYIYATCIKCGKEHHLNSGSLLTTSYELST